MGGEMSSSCNVDAAQYAFPQDIDGVLSTFAITLIPEYDEIIKRGVSVLRPGKRLVILDFSIPTNVLSVLVPAGIAIMRPFGVTRDLADRHPWESIERHMHNLTMENVYGGFAYIARGENSH